MTIRTCLTTAICALTVGLTGPSLAADLPSRLEPIPPAALFETEPASSWSGFYVGASIGGQSNEHGWTTRSLQNPGTTAAGIFDDGSSRLGLNSTRFRATGHLGYNFQITQTFVAGLEADMGGPVSDSRPIQGIPGTFGGATLLTQAGNLDQTRALIHWDASIRARVGVLATPNVLFYATSGLAFAATRYGVSCPGVFPVGSWCTTGQSELQTHMRTGWTLGAGVDAILSDPSWIVRAEYRYSDFGYVNRTFFSATSADAVNARIALRTHTFMVGLSYKFAERPAPLIVRY